mgnify:CR=1 FL=1
MKNLLAKKDIKKKIKIALKEDFGKYGDITSKVLISKKTKLKASIVAKENAIVCGTEFAVQTFKALNSKIKIKVLKKDGSKVVKGNKIIDVNGDAQSILIAERTALNFLGFMSGIATKTRKFVDIAAPYGVKIYSTRKTIAGMRQVQKYAYGGIVNKPTLFPMKNGIGLMGEAGAEAILPLRRGSNGKLGVQSTGGGFGNIVVNVDASGSSVEGSQEGGRELGRVIAVAIQSELVKQKRPGGILA